MCNGVLMAVVRIIDVNMPYDLFPAIMFCMHRCIQAFFFHYTFTIWHPENQLQNLEAQLQNLEGTHLLKGARPTRFRCRIIQFLMTALSNS